MLWIQPEEPLQQLRLNHNNPWVQLEPEALLEQLLQQLLQLSTIYLVGVNLKPKNQCMLTIKAMEAEIKEKVAVSSQTCLLTTLDQEEDHHHLDLNIYHLDLNLKDLEDLEGLDLEDLEDLVDQEEDHLILMDQEDLEDRG